jgi:7,8-dihydropterin-6-yl-methyl-4-(beta-D-ribofuranosyl)aminobenzene 5'-phosphate synthase
VNTLEYVRYLNPGMNVHAVLGGFHLMNADEHRLEKTIETFCELDIPMVVPCHCTGADAYRTLAGALGETVSPGAAGATFEF